MEGLDFFNTKKGLTTFWKKGDGDLDDLVNTEEIFESQMLIENPQKNTIKEKTIFIARNYLGILEIENERKVVRKYIGLDEIVVSLKNGQVSSLSYTLLLSNSGYLLRLHTIDEEIIKDLYTAMRPHCILTDFRHAYKVTKLVGQGATAKVYIGHLKDNPEKEYAVKAFLKQDILADKRGLQSLRNELRLLRRLRGHPHVIWIYEVYESTSNVYLVMELQTGGTLQSKIQKVHKMSVEQSLAITKQLVDAISFIHNRNIMHRDLKLANILIVEDKKKVGVKIVDFGLATDIDDVPYLCHRCGTPGYVAPEVFKTKEGDRYDSICDVFSLGVIIYILVTGRTVFPGESFNTVLKANRSGQVNFNELRQHVHNPAVFELIRGMLEPDPKKRITVKELLEHPNLKGLEVDVALAEIAMEKSPAITPTHRFKKDLSANKFVFPNENEDLGSFVCGKSSAIDGKQSALPFTTINNDAPSPMMVVQRQLNLIGRERAKSQNDLLRNMRNINGAQAAQKQNADKNDKQNKQASDDEEDIDENVSGSKKVNPVEDSKAPSKLGRAANTRMSTTPNISSGRILPPGARMQLPGFEESKNEPKKSIPRFPDVTTAKNNLKLAVE